MRQGSRIVADRTLELGWASGISVPPIQKYRPRRYASYAARFADTRAASRAVRGEMDPQGANEPVRDRE